VRFIELFAGIGGFRYGLEKVGQLQPLLGRPKDSGNPKSTTKFNRRPQYTCVWANEIDKHACQIYRKNFGEGELYEGDIRTVRYEDIPEAELLVGGFPCQAFSIAGKRKGFEDTRGTLFYEITRIARANRYKTLLLENVYGLLSHEGGDTFATILGVLDEMGYDVEWQVLNSKDFGVPQNRERVFIVGHLRGTSRPEVFPIGYSNELGANSNKKLSEQISNTLRTNYSSAYSNETYVGERKESYAIDSNYHKGTNTLDKGRRQMVYEDYKIRRLTPTECERLQGFPDGWTEGISDTQRYKCLGNAVTTNVISEIGRRLNGRHIN